MFIGTAAVRKSHLDTKIIHFLMSTTEQNTFLNNYMTYMRFTQ